MLGLMEDAGVYWLHAGMSDQTSSILEKVYLPADRHQSGVKTSTQRCSPVHMRQATRANVLPASQCDGAPTPRVYMPGLA